jgi:hypothetical protein
MQRAVLLAVLSFVFFMTMMFTYYLRHNLLYFLLATAFLIVYLVTMYSFITGKKKSVELFENGLRVGRSSATWPEIVSVDRAGVIAISSSKKLEIAESIYEREALLSRIRTSVAGRVM